MRRLSITFFILIFSVSQSMAQTYTLEQCIDSAIKNYIPVQQSGLSAESAHVNLKQAKNNVLPNLLASLNQGMNFGRGIDVSTNTYVNQSINVAYYGLQSGLTLFSGFTLQNRIKESAFAYEASRMDYQQAKDNLILNVILNYLLVLNNEDQLKVAQTQAEYSRLQLERLHVMDSVGGLKPSDVSDMKGQLMNDRLNMLNAQSQVESAKLSLAQLMNVAYSTSMQLERINVNNMMDAYNIPVADVYENALKDFSLVKAAGLRTKSSYYSWKAAKGQFYPTLSIAAGLNTNYSSIAQNSAGKIAFTDQLQSNKFSTLGLGLYIPVFNNFYARNRSKLANIVYKNYNLTEENTRLQLKKDIDQAYINMTYAINRYHLLEEQVDAYKQSFAAAEVRYNAGVGSSIDYLTAKDKLDRASINLVNARYDFVLRKKLLDYYQGKK